MNAADDGESNQGDSDTDSHDPKAQAHIVHLIFEHKTQVLEKDKFFTIGNVKSRMKWEKVISEVDPDDTIHLMNESGSGILHHTILTDRLTVLKCCMLNEDF
jgi:hypothetical protein